MRIGLISDTHIPIHARALPAQINEVFSGVDLILHAGDIYTVPVLDELGRIAPVLAAKGDDDFQEVINDSRVKWKHVLEMEGIVIWLTHVRPWVLLPQPEKSPDVIVFGHTHEAVIEDGGGMLQVNPGSATFPGYKREPGTVGLLTVALGKADAQIIQLK